METIHKGSQQIKKKKKTEWLILQALITTEQFKWNDKSCLEWLKT